ncbi:MAG: IclR family transcriptional regulator [Actinomycetota bacterium]
MTASPTLITSVRRALSLLDSVGESTTPRPAKVLAHRAGLPLPTSYHLLRTLVHEGYLRRVDGGYVLGDRVAALSARTTAARADRIHPILQGVRDELRAAAYYSVLRDGEIELVDIADGPEAPRADLWVGFHEAAHATALGKAVLSAIGEEERRAYLADHELADLTPRTVTDRRLLLHLLTTSHEYTVDREEYALGTACVATVVPSTVVVAAVAVSVPARQVQRVVAQGDVLRRAARLIAYAVAG